MRKAEIDNGKAFDFGRTSPDYARYRDIYPKSLYEKLVMFGIGMPGQHILDLGTGTGVLPRNLRHTGARFTGADLSPKQIQEAKRLSAEAGMHDVEYLVWSAEETGLPGSAFDAVTAVQCFHYFDTSKVLPECKRIIKPGGLLCKVFMEWLPYEDEKAAEMEALVLKYNPDWGGCGFRGFRYSYPDWAEGFCELETVHCYKEDLLFEKDSWRGRIRTCRGVGASLQPEQVKAFDEEYKKILNQYPGRTLQIKHQIQFELYRMIP